MSSVSCRSASLVALAALAPFGAGGAGVCWAALAPGSGRFAWSLPWFGALRVVGASCGRFVVPGVS